MLVRAVPHETHRLTMHQVSTSFPLVCFFWARRAQHASEEERIHLEACRGDISNKHQDLSRYWCLNNSAEMEYYWDLLSCMGIARNMDTSWEYIYMLNKIRRNMKIYTLSCHQLLTIPSNYLFFNKQPLHKHLDIVGYFENNMWMTCGAGGCP